MGSAARLRLLHFSIAIPLLAKLTAFERTYIQTLSVTSAGGIALSFKHALHVNRV